MITLTRKILPTNLDPDALHRVNEGIFLATNLDLDALPRVHEKLLPTNLDLDALHRVHDGIFLPTNLDVDAHRCVHQGVFLQADLDHLALCRVQHEIRCPVHHVLYHVQDHLVPFLLAAVGTTVHLEDERVLLDEILLRAALDPHAPFLLVSRVQAAPRVHGHTTLPPKDDIRQSVKEHNLAANGAQERARQDKIHQKLSCHIARVQNVCRLHGAIDHEKDDVPFDRNHAKIP